MPKICQKKYIFFNIHIKIDKKRAGYKIQPAHNITYYNFTKFSANSTFNADKAGCGHLLLDILLDKFLKYNKIQAKCIIL